MSGFVIPRHRRSPWIDAASAATALAVCALVFLLLIWGLAVDAWRRHDPAATQVTLVPLPVPEPPKPEPPRPEPAKPLKRASPTPGAPAPLQASPIEQPDTTIVALAPPAPPAASTDGQSGPGTGSGIGTGSGGAGNGGSGTTVARKIRLLPASWSRRPNARELRSYYPGAARSARIDGAVLLACGVLPDKRVTGCRVLREIPRGFGFGAAALEASGDFRLNPPRRDEDADTETRVVIPVNFGP